MTSWTEILKANKGLHARDSFSELWGLKLKAARAEFPDYTITGTLPLSFNSRVAGTLKNYRVYGDSDGSGVQTENLWDGSYESWGINGSTGGIISMIDRYAIVVPITPNIEYTISRTIGSSTYFYYGLRTNAPVAGATCDYYANIGAASTRFTFNSEQYNYVIFFFGTGLSDEIMVVEGSTAPTTYIPPGYKIPISLQSGVTENLFDIDDIQQVTVNDSKVRWGVPFSLEPGTYTCKAFSGVADSYIYAMIKHSDNSYSDPFYIIVNDSAYHPSVSIVSGDTLFIYNAYANSTEEQTIQKCTAGQVMLVSGSTPPDHYIPHRYTSNYDLFIGDSKLGATEYLSFAEQKIYKDVSGTLTPTDPPVPLPAINAYQGENTLSSTETVGEVSITGKITEMA